MFRTELPLTPHPQQLPLSARVLTIGSCFSDSIGSRLRDFKVTTMVNPFGTVFNPISVCRLLRAAAGEDMDWQQHVVEARGRWQSHDLHAEIGAETPVELLQHIQTLTREVGVFLATADAVVLTLGSAFAYRLRETDEIISNCHKLPAEKFEKELLTADDIIAAVAETHAYLRRINPRLRFILTVSPVRHIKDTLVLNSTSKSMLRVACHYLSELLPDVTYFPAYELLLDDLRDYRFYAADMLHPSEVAENYIWERFTRTYFDAAFGRFKKEWEGIRQAMGHKPTYAAAPEHRQFLESTLERLRRLGPQADVRMETLHLERELAELPLPYSAPEPEPEEDDDDEERIDIGEYAEKTPTSQASLLGAGAGILREDPSDDDDEEEEQDEPASTPDSAYEHAYAAGLTGEEQDEEDAEEADAAIAEGEEPARRKKRRSRGGAKRTKRKHARLAAEAAGSVASEQVTSSLELLTAVGTEEVQQAARVEQMDAEHTDAEHPSAPAENSEPEQNEPARRSRNNRRNQRERPERSGSRPARPALYAEKQTATEAAGTPEPIAPAAAEENQPITQPAPMEQAPQPSDAELAVTETFALPEAEAQVPRPKRAPASRSRKKPVAKTEPVQEAVASSEEVAAVEQANPTQAELPVVATEVAASAPKARARRKPVAKVAALEAPVAAEPTAEPSIDIPAATTAETPAAKPSRKRPARKPKPAETTEAAAEPVAPVEMASELPAETPTVPKRKPRPPRKKPATDASATENS